MLAAAFPIDCAVSLDKSGVVILGMISFFFGCVSKKYKRKTIQSREFINILRTKSYLGLLGFLYIGSPIKPSNESATNIFLIPV